MAKEPAGAILSMLAPSREADRTMQRQLYEHIRGAVLDGTLPAASRLPSTRTLAREWGVSRNTVVFAYEQLTAEGYLVSRTGSGTYVPEDLPEDFLEVQRALRARRNHRPGTLGTARLAERGAALMQARYCADPTPPLPFAPGVPAVDAFPIDLWRRLTADRLNRATRHDLCCGEPMGYEPLRRAIANYLRTARAVECTWEQILIVSGSQQGLDLASRLLVDPGDTCWIEEPGYSGAKGALSAAGARLIPVPADQDGIRVEDGVRKAPKARLAYVTPSHQYPLGMTMTLCRRMALLEWAASNDSWILEDDYDSEFRFAGKPLASLQGLDERGRVLYLGTFSKVLFPSLRLAYFVLPPPLIKPFRMARALSDGHPPTLNQLVLADFINQGHFATHLRRMRGLYRRRQDLFVTAARRLLDGCLELAPSECGLHLIGYLPSGISDVDLAKKLSAEGIRVDPLSSTYCSPGGRNGLMLGFGCVHESDIEPAVERLASVLCGDSRRL